MIKQTNAAKCKLIPPTEESIDLFLIPRVIEDIKKACIKPLGIVFKGPVRFLTSKWGNQQPQPV
jgi:hypothetical protein